MHRLLPSLLVLATVTTPAMAQAVGRANSVGRASGHVIAYRSLGNGKAVGVSSPLHVRVEEADPGRVRVGFFESEVAGSGDQWRAAGWTAALAASMLLDFDARTSRIAFDVEGRIDGPSAGGLMTVAVMAAVRGDGIRRDATMTGTINPDGRIGPVGGIAQKIEAAAAIGKKLVLIPAGTRFQEDVNVGKKIDLVAKGQGLGVKVLQVPDIWTAYRELTGERLPRAEATQPPQASPEFVKRVSDLYDDWAGMLKAKTAEFEAISDDFKTEYTDELVEESDQYLKYARGLKEEGRYAAAFSDLTAAVSRMTSAIESSRCVEEDDRRGVEAMIRRVRDDGWLDRDVEATLGKFRDFSPATIEQLSIYIEAVDFLTAGLAFQVYADDILAGMPKSGEDERWEHGHDAAEYQKLAALNFVGARQMLAEAKRLGGSPLADDAPVLVMAQYFLRATDANIEMLEESVIEPAANQLGIPQERLQNRLSEIDEDFASLMITRRRLVPQLVNVFGEGDSLAYGLLGVTADMYARSSSIVAQYYSMQLVRDEDGYLVGVKEEGKLADWLMMSDEQTRRTIRELVEAGVDPSTCVSYYEPAKVAQGRDVYEKLYALQAYFRANAIARALKRLAPPKSP